MHLRGMDLCSHVCCYTYGTSQYYSYVCTRFHSTTKHYNPYQDTFLSANAYGVWKLSVLKDVDFHIGSQSSLNCCLLIRGNGMKVI